MDKDLFDELLASISEAGAILRGEREPARTTSLEVASVPDCPDSRAIREQLKLTRPQFAALIGVSERTGTHTAARRSQTSGSRPRHDPADTPLLAWKHPLRCSRCACRPAH
jgi:DNA-binding transcriptional regulator YiaG